MPLEDLTGGLFSDASISTQVGALLAEEGTHPRSVIRAAVASELQAQSAIAGRIRESRILPYDEKSELPAVGIYTLSDQVVKEDVSPRRLWIELDLVLDVVTALSGTLDGGDHQLESDAIEHVIHKVIGSNRTLEGVLSSIVFNGSETQIIRQSERIVVHNALTFKVVYQLEVKDIVSDDLKTVGVDWDLASPDGTPEAQDELNFGGGS